MLYQVADRVLSAVGYIHVSCSQEFMQGSNIRQV